MEILAYINQSDLELVKEQVPSISDSDLSALSDPQQPLERFAQNLAVHNLEPSDFQHNLRFVADDTLELYGNFDLYSIDSITCGLRRWFSRGLTIADLHAIYDSGEFELITDPLNQTHFTLYPSVDDYENRLMESLDYHARENLEEVGVYEFLDNSRYFFSCPPPTVIELPSGSLFVSTNHTPLLTP